MSQLTLIIIILLFLGIVSSVMLKRVLSPSVFLKDVVTLSAGTIFAQAIPFLLSPIITRLYTPEEFAVFALYISITSVISVIITGRYELAIVLPKEEKAAKNIFFLSIVLTVCLSLITFVIFFSGSSFISELLNNYKIENWLILVPISVCAIGLYQTFSYWAIRNKSFKGSSIAKITDSIFNTGTKIGLGYLALGSGGLILSTLLGQIISIVVLGKMVVFNRLEKWKGLISQKEILDQAKNYSDFPKINMLHALFDAIQASLLIFLISLFFDNAVLGLYAFSIRLLKTPLGLIGVSTGQVFYQRATDIYSSGGNLNGFVKKNILSLVSISIPILIILMVFGPQLFNTIFGEEWEMAGQYARILAPWLMMNFIVSPISQLPIIVNKQKQVFYISLIGFFLNIAALLIGGIILKSETSTFVMLSCFQVAYLSFVIFWILKISKNVKKN